MDGLRGIAILLVILYHNFNFIEYFNYGWLGVDLFFVLSGFLITDILLRTLQEPHYFRNFYVRRVLRIFPLYYLVLVFFILVLPLFNNTPVNTSYYTRHQAWFWTYLQNWLFILHPEGDTRALFHFWSLAVEEQFYLIWPLLIFLIKKPKKVFIVSLLLLILVIIARILIWRYRSHFQTFEWLLLFTRIDGILIGSMLAALIRYNPQLPKKYFTAFVVIFTAFNFLYYFFKKGQDPNFPVWAIGGFTSFCFVFAIFVYLGLDRENRVINSLLTIKPLTVLGRYSYGFYVFHLPVKLFLDKPVTGFAAVVAEKNIFLQNLTAAIIVSAAGFLLSVLSYHTFEKHFLKMKRYFIS